MLGLSGSKIISRKKALSAVMGLALGGAAYICLSVPDISSAYATTEIGGTTLTSQAVTAIQSHVANAMAAISPGLTGEARDQGIAAAIAQVAETEVAAYGAGAAGEIASTIIAAASGVSPADVGEGLGLAATLITATDFNAAKAMARTVANEGTPGMGSAFAMAIKKAGGPSELAEIATASPEVTGAIGGVGFAFGASLPPPLPPPPPPCGTPSCT